MKTNITINIQGQLFHIDEDAYALLKNYEEKIQHHYATQDNREEKINDAERRIAAHFTAINAQGTEAIDIEHVQQLIQQNGYPPQSEEHIPSESPEEQPPLENQEVPTTDCPPPPPFEHPTPQEPCPRGPKRLYRDVAHSILGGVSSGLAIYWGVADPIFLRIAWVLLFFLPYCPAIIIYLILWIVIPAALTPEDRAKMEGKSYEDWENSANPSTQKKSNDANPISSHDATRKSYFPRSVGSVILKTCLIFLLAFFVLLSCFSVAALLVFTLATPAFILSYSFVSTETATVISTIYAHGWQIWVLTIALIATIGIPLYLLFRHIFLSHPPLHVSRRILLTIVWLATLIISILFIISVTVNLKTEFQEQKRLEQTRNGISLYGRSWNILDKGNWKVVQLQNAEPYIYSHCKNLFRENREESYLRIKCLDKGNPLRATLIREESAEPGRYRLEAVVSIQGDGCCLFARTANHTNSIVTSIPSNEEVLFRIEEMPWNVAQDSHYFQNTTDSICWKRIQNNSRDNRWCFVTSEPFTHYGGRVEYGISNDTELTQHRWNGQGFDIYEIVLTPLNDELTAQPL